MQKAKFIVLVVPCRLPPASNLSLRRERGRKRPGQRCGVEGDTMQWYLVAALLTVLTSSQAIPASPVSSSSFSADLIREAAQVCLQPGFGCAIRLLGNLGCFLSRCAVEWVAEVASICNSIPDWCRHYHIGEKRTSDECHLGLLGIAK